MIEEIFGSKVKIKILRFFFDFPLVKRNVREIAKECRIGFGVAANTLKDLRNSGIISEERTGKEINYSLNTNSEFYEPVKKLFELEKEKFGNLPFFYKNLISDVITSTKRIADACFLFGSLVTGSFTSKSDVDLFFVSSKEEKVRDVCIKIEKKYETKLQVIVLNKSEIKKFKKSSLFKTIKKESLLLFDNNRIKEMIG
ncbi:MAG: nucleotidyltransferase domain-containing protein [Candidatus Aenigmarchaeota archaeon]|nr:nucleotidyltransferase domain-containing protein [Candidatus Aenigmarchaeota archaeon]